MPLDIESAGARPGRSAEIRSRLDHPVIDSDAHATAHFGLLHYGIAQARRGWATAADVLNTLPLKEFLASLKDGQKAGGR